MEDKTDYALPLFLAQFLTFISWQWQKHCPAQGEFMLSMSFLRKKLHVLYPNSKKSADSNSSVYFFSKE
jgi:hypothetical protein